MTVLMCVLVVLGLVFIASLVVGDPHCARKQPGARAVTPEEAEAKARELSFQVPPGFVLTRQEEIDRLHNESEARRIERDAAQARIDQAVAVLTESPAPQRKGQSDA